MCSYWCWVRTSTKAKTPSPAQSASLTTRAHTQTPTQATKGLYPYEGSNCYFPHDKNHHGPPTDFCMGPNG